MGSVSRYVVAFVALAVLVVLITPALDELPCTAVHKSPVLASVTSAPLVFLPVLSAATQPIAGVKRAVIVDDVRSLTCTFLC